ncbi:MAG: hypothetical protein AAB676_12240 [Verrucomicrobiota bacterium]
MKTPFLLLVSACVILVGCSKKETAPAPTPTNAPAASGNPITAPVDYLGAVAKAKTVAEKTIDTAALKQHIQLFYAQEGRFPKDLNELVKEKYIPSLPPAPHGMKFSYDAAKGEIKIVPQ